MFHGKFHYFYGHLWKITIFSWEIPLFLPFSIAFSYFTRPGIPIETNRLSTNGLNPPRRVRAAEILVMHPVGPDEKISHTHTPYSMYIYIYVYTNNHNK